jgi:glucose/arabinose dehydrogenase
MSSRFANRFWSLLALTATLAAACGGGGGSEPKTASARQERAASVRLERVVDGLSFPLDFAGPQGDPSRQFIAEKGGRIRVLRDGVLIDTPFLDLSGRVSGGSEQGLLGIAFHPGYPGDGRFFVNYTDRAGDTHVASFRVSADPDVADAGSGADVLFVDQPFPNHNGGGLAFGPDGFLYIGLGDGGGAGDPAGNGQSLSTLLGKILRIDVEGASPYAIPAGNPFGASPGARGEIWSYGLRNPFRFSFDRGSGDMYIGDVGQAALEEIDFAGRSNGGQNFGWSRTEGTQCFGSANCDRSGITFPIAEYGHDAGCSVTGGYVYRGAAIPALQGEYFYGDFCSGFVRSLHVDGGSASGQREWPELAPGDSITSFGQDAAGEIYVVTAGGAVFRVAPAS